MTARVRSGKLGRISLALRQALAALRYGTPLAADARWLEAQAAEEAARLRHGPTRRYQAEKARLIHEALIAGRGR